MVVTVKEVYTPAHNLFRICVESDEPVYIQQVGTADKVLIGDSIVVAAAQYMITSGDHIELVEPGASR